MSLKFEENIVKRIFDCEDNLSLKAGTEKKTVVD